MPELKRLFVKGRMNKDLDERLVPNGEYRDALNIQIGSSEGSDVGAIENILGNQVAKLKKAQPATYWELNTESANYYGLPLDSTCIGAIKDDINDKIYWFVTSSTIDCIIEYENQYGQVRPVLVDTQGVLNFSSNKLITAINILENYLFFTDDNSEPKKIDVTKNVFVSPDFVTHSLYKDRDFIESDITVIKKSPLRAPEMSLSNSKRGGNVVTTAVKNWTESGSNSGGLSAALPLTENTDPEVFYTIDLATSCDYLEGDVLNLAAASLESDTTNSTYRAIVQVVDVISPIEVSVSLISISPQVPDDDNFVWRVTLQQEDPPFELKFPRFGYRWKYNDNQFSCFSPFTEVAFLPTVFEYNARKGYNSGMVNTAQLINLFDPAKYTNQADFESKVVDLIPVDVEKIEILYKETNNSTIYVVDDFVPADLVYSTWKGFKITSDLIYKVVQSNQILRPWDNVPRLAKSQEIVGNRVVYGNYLQNYNLNTDIKIAGASRIIQKNINEHAKSVKSGRDYQIGVVFKDEYGRETPVFTNNEAAVQINSVNSADANTLSVKGVGAAPQGFTHYKYFVKDKASEYYNIAAERLFPSKDGVTMWMSFPSVERNKLAEEDYIILKKGHDSSLPVISKDNKYKILDISNEAPAEIKETRTLEYTAEISFGVSFGSYTVATTKTPGATPTALSATFVIAQENATDGLTDEFVAKLKPATVIRFTSNTGSSNFYTVSGVEFGGVDEAAKVYLTAAFGQDVNFLYKTDGTDDLRVTTTNQIQVYKANVDDKNAKFQGFFFAKIEKNATLTENVFSDQNLIGIDSATYLPFSNLNAPTDNNNENGQIATDTNYGPAFDPSNNIFLQMWGGGVSPRRGYGIPHYNGGLDGADSGSVNDILGEYNLNVPPFADGVDDKEWDFVVEMLLLDSIELNEGLTRTPDELPLNYWDSVKTIGTRLRFSNHDTVYTITDVGIHTQRVDPYGGVTVIPVDTTQDFLQRIYVELDKPLEKTINPNFLTTDGFVTMSILGLPDGVDYTSSNPAVFETEPKDLADLNIYYEASDAYPISEYNNSKILSWHNCFAFGNGIESNRVRDDFNAAFIDKGTKASTVLEEPYQSERRLTGLIYSGIYNSTSGLNSLNQFIQAEKITKDLNPIYGSIQKLHTRDTNLVALCEDKILRILANKDALFNADGNANVTSNNNVLGQAVPFAGEFGISKNPESFASYGYRAYFSDKKRGVMLRLSMDGLTDISGKGMNDFFYDNLKAATTVLGSYDIYSDCYNVTLNNTTASFKESLDGWPTRKSFIPEWGISLNADYYTMSNGMLWSHDNEERNTFYEGATEKSSVQLIFNDNPSNIKNFKTLSYEGSQGWISPLIETDQQDGAVTTFLDKENIYYNYIRGLNDTWDNSAQTGTLDLKQFAAQGIGQPSSIEPYAGNTTFTVTVKNDPNN